MFISRIFGRAALAAWLALAFSVAALSQGSLAQSAATFRDILVDVRSLRANAGGPTATHFFPVRRALDRQRGGRSATEGA
jgi:hypothetical protein